MTTFEALVSVSQMLLRANGRWWGQELDETLRRDIRATVFDAAKLFREVGDENGLIGMAIAELERRATPYSVECPHCHWGFAPHVFDRHLREKHPL